MRHGSPPVRGSSPMVAASTASLSSSAGAQANFSSSSRMGSTGRAEQIIQNVYSKVAQVIVQARATEHARRSLSSGRKLNKWFNLETLDIESLKEELKYWRAHAITSPQPPPLIIDIFLDLSALTASQVLMLRDELTQRRQRIGHEHLQAVDPSTGISGRHKSVLLESWQLTLSHPIASQAPELPVVYKKSVALFRSLYSYVRLLPAYRLYRKLRRQKDGNLGIGYRLSTSRVMPVDEAGLDQLHSSGDMRRGLSEYNFGSIDTPFGVFSLHVNYRLECDFSVEDPEAVLGTRLGDMDEHYFSPRSLDRARDIGSGPLLLQQARRSSSSSSRRGVIHQNDDMTRTSSAGSLPRRTSRYGSQTSVHSQDGFHTGRDYGRGGVPPVNIPPGSLPTRVGHRHSYSTASTSSSPGVFQFQRTGTPSPSSHHSSSQQHLMDRRQSWQVSPASNPSVAAFTPPSAAFSMGGRQDFENARFNEPPPFSANTDVAEPQVVPEILTADVIPFTSHSPPFDMQLSNKTHAKSVLAHRASFSVSRSASPVSTDLARRPSVTFPTASVPFKADISHSPPSFFTPNSSSLGRPLPAGYKLSPPPLANLSSGSGSSAMELGEFFRTLELGRRSLRISDTPSGEGTAYGVDNCGPGGHEGSIMNAADSSLARLSRTKLVLARYRELNELNAAFSNSLSEFIASEELDGPSEMGESHPQAVVETISPSNADPTDLVLSPRPLDAIEDSRRLEQHDDAEYPVLDTESFAFDEAIDRPRVGRANYPNSLPNHLQPVSHQHHLDPTSSTPIAMPRDHLSGGSPFMRREHNDSHGAAHLRRRSVATLLPDHDLDKHPGRPPDRMSPDPPIASPTPRTRDWIHSTESSHHVSRPSMHLSPGWSGGQRDPAFPYGMIQQELTSTRLSNPSHESSEEDEELLFNMSGLDLCDSRECM
ncbi:uncharacterized protein SPPG_02001 [Spizellomyces punctatus DAOM BR117]|uniref:Autophagy-related protein 13 n=1 Tax=Spizellomyces punctatus (strain DAOM BR117) TaxID=645134 RepID=A0A0L0HPM7_SPIPD|nr:uncharacterized protein SPPG_02001 [Spizellomyces punctatus DAOM BR117]KND02920.1 hypothetical protein SPPG_02001 [Spizellomyces punctatus DAOM BR117]|eukprot:XP_016610959.1 hypothetical protein SPPG_02001 [Spizellomyces punctatus DAOM BR117]